MSWETLTYEKPEQGIAVVTFNRPRRANAISQHMLRELKDVCRVLDADDKVRCVVVTGAGLAFSSENDQICSAASGRCSGRPRGYCDHPRDEASFITGQVISVKVA